jgi:hypothetical protein
MPLYQQGGLQSSKGTLQGLPQIVAGFLQAKQRAQAMKLKEREVAAQEDYMGARGKYYTGGGSSSQSVSHLVPMKFKKDGQAYSVIVDKRTGQVVSDLSELGEPLRTFNLMEAMMGGEGAGYTPGSILSGETKPAPKDEAPKIGSQIGPKATVPPLAIPLNDLLAYLEKMDPQSKEELREIMASGDEEKLKIAYQRMQDKYGVIQRPNR